MLIKNALNLYVILKNINNSRSGINISVNLILKNHSLIDKTAQLISLVTAAPIVSIPIFILLNLLNTTKSFFLISGICLLFAGIIPLFLIILWTKRIKNTTMDIPNKEDRPFLFVFIILSYIVGTIGLYFLNANWLVFGLMLGYLTNTIVILIINFFWKISVHSMGIAIPLAVLFYVNVFATIILGCVLIIVMWSRVHLQKHNITQVLGGALLGVLFTGFQLFLLKTLLP